jgi:hypothetical protein
MAVFLYENGEGIELARFIAYCNHFRYNPCLIDG